jgi:hypothetical protein
MELSVEVKLHGLFLRDPGTAIKIYEEEIKRGFEEGSSLMLREVDKRTPRGLTGNLAGSLFREVRASGLDLYAVVATPLYYARRVEETIAYTPEFASLLEWVRLKLGVSGRHLYPITKVIYRNISARGQRVARMMFQGGFEAGTPKVIKILEQARDRIVARWQ